MQADFYGHYAIEQHKRLRTQRIEYFGTPRMINNVTEAKQFYSDLRAILLWQANEMFSSYVDTEKIHCKMIVNFEAIL